MSVCRYSLVVAALCGGISASTFAQSSVPVRRLTPAVSTDSGVFTSLTGVRPLSNGSVLANDMFRRRLTIFDSTFARHSVVADTAAGAPNRYPNTFAQIIPYLGDSTLLVDREAQVVQLLNGSGAFVRAMAMPNNGDLQPLAIIPGGAATDPQGRLVYRVTRRHTTTPPRPDSGKVVTVTYHDSAMIVRANFDTRTVDSVATHSLPVQMNVSVSAGAGTFMSVAANPLPQTDEWTMLPDGTIAIVRGGDYHIDWVRTDGTRSSSPKMPFDWKRVTDEDKQRMIDSTRQAAADRDAARAAAGPAGASAGASAGAAGAGGRGASFGPVAVGGAPGAPGAGPAGFTIPKIPFMTVDKADLPDYYPPIRSGTVRSDPEGNVWILPTTSVFATGGLTFDVVNRKGEVVERVQLPPGRNLMAVGPGGVVYMSVPAAPGGPRLERARIIR